MASGMADVFIAYSRKDQEFVTRLYNALSEYGINTWIDQQNIPIASDWSEQIQSGIANADKFIFVMSPNSVKSQVARQELQYALSINKHIIPVIYEEVSNRDVPFTLSTIQWVDMTGANFDRGIKILVDALQTGNDTVQTKGRPQQKVNVAQNVMPTEVEFEDFDDRDDEREFSSPPEFEAVEAYQEQQDFAEVDAVDNLGSSNVEQHDLYTSEASPPESPTRELGQRFRETERQVALLRTRYDNGDIDYEQLQSQLQELQVLDENDQWWMVGVETNDWYRYDQETQNWVTGYPRALEILNQQEPQDEISQPVLGEQRYNPFLHADKGTRDLLDITPDVEALATLIAADNTPLPLAIGIFGKWGSGKTFFMNRLEEKIIELSSMPPPPDDMPDAPRFYPEIAHIRFNAWHYVEGKLWAGLVEYIFSELVRIDKAKKTQDERSLLEETLEFHEEEKSAAEALKVDAQQNLDEAHGTLTQLQQDLASKRAELSRVSTRDILALMLQDESVDAETKKILATLQLTNLVNASKDVNVAYVEAKDSTVRLWETIRNNPVPMGIAILLFVLIPLLVYVLQQTGNWLDGQPIVALLAGVVSILSGIATFLRTYARAQLAAQEAVEQRQQQLVEKVDTKHQELVDEIAAKEAEIANLETQIQSAEQTRQQAQDKVNETEARLDALRPERVLHAFLSDRTTTDDYRKHLGIPAVIRRDLQKLSGAIRDYNQMLKDNRKNNQHTPASPPESEGNIKPPTINLNRVVLYIDDLDRCPPDIVVKVLEAVHLISAFEAFVVVVGVDMYWLQDALNVHIKDMQIDAAKYLKKIFQIPLWLLPMSEQATRKYLDGLLKDNVVESAASQQSLVLEDPPQPVPEDLDLDAIPLPGFAAQHGGEPVGEDFPQELIHEGEQLPQISEPPQATAEERAVTNLAALQTNQDELEYMQELAPIIGTSPREVKRFVNLYRLFKVSGLTKDLNIPLDQKQGATDFQIVMVILAIFVGQDDASDYLIDALELDVRKSQSFQQLLDIASDKVSRTSNLNREQAEYELSRIEQWLQDKPHLLQLDVRQLAYHVARYSFELAG